MENSKEFIICIVLTALGILLIALATPAPMHVGDITDELAGKTVHLHTIIESKHVHGENIFLGTYGGKAVIFGQQAKQMQSDPYFLETGDEATLIGQVQMYRGEPELIVEQVAL